MNDDGRLRKLAEYSSIPRPADPPAPPQEEARPKTVRQIAEGLRGIADSWEAKPVGFLAQLAQLRGFAALVDVVGDVADPSPSTDLCTWTQNRHLPDWWRTACGVESGSPAGVHGDRFKACPYCTKPLREVAYQETP